MFSLNGRRGQDGGFQHLAGVLLRGAVGIDVVGGGVQQGVDAGDRPAQR
jgi:hypothetical protein